MTLSVGVTTFMFMFAYIPQVAIMAFTSGPLAALSAALLTLSESSTIVNIISRTFLIDEALIDTFDGTLISRDCTELVSAGRHVQSSGMGPIGKLGRLITKPLAKLTPSAIIKYFLYLPLNFIPVIGTVIFVLLQGKRNGPGAHARYFQLKGWSKRQQEAFIEQYRGAYTSYVGALWPFHDLSPFLVALFVLQLTDHPPRSQIRRRRFPALDDPVRQYGFCLHERGRSCLMGGGFGEG